MIVLKALRRDFSTPESREDICKRLSLMHCDMPTLMSEFRPYPTDGSNLSWRIEPGNNYFIAFFEEAGYENVLRITHRTNDEWAIAFGKWVAIRLAMAELEPDEVTR